MSVETPACPFLAHLLNVALILVVLLESLCKTPDSCAIFMCNDIRYRANGMDVEEREALQILQGAFWVSPDDLLNEFKRKYRKWLLQGNHPDIGGSGQNFDRVRQAYHVHANYLKNIQKQSAVDADSTNYYEFAAHAIAKIDYVAAFMAYSAALCAIQFEHFFTDCQK